MPRVKRRLVFFKATTGERITSVPAFSKTYEVGRGKDDTLTCTIPLYDRRIRNLDISNIVEPNATIMAIVENDRVTASGVIWSHPSYDHPNHRLQVSAVGVGSVLTGWYIMPPNTTAENMLLPESAGDDAGKPNPAVGTYIHGRPFAYIVRGWIQQALNDPARVFPFEFFDSSLDGVGSHDRDIEASSLKTIQSAIDDIAGDELGVETRYLARLSDDGNFISYMVQVGDDKNPYLGQDIVHRFDETSGNPNIKNIQVQKKGTDLAQRVWGTGGQINSQPLLSMAESPVNQLAERVFRETNISHTTVEIQETLDGYTRQAAEDGSKLTVWLTFDVRATGIPDISQISVGDSADIIAKEDDYFKTFYRGNKFRVRIAQISYDGGEWASITADGEAIG